MNEERYKEWDKINCGNRDCDTCEFDKECVDFGLTHFARKIIELTEEEQADKVMKGRT